MFVSNISGYLMKLDYYYDHNQWQVNELLSNLVFEVFWSCGDLAWFCGFNSVFEFDASDDFGEGVKAA